MSLTHIDSKGNLKMVKILNKPETFRRAGFSGRILMAPATVKLIRENRIRKGNVLNTAKMAGIMAAKQTEKLIPLCHGLNMEHIDLDFFIKRNEIEVVSIAETTYKTGVEMEASVALSVALLTIYDMCKAVDRTMEIGRIRLIEKSGGKTLFYRMPIESINISKKKGIKKRPIQEAQVIKDLGIEGDAHAEKGSRRQVSFLSTKSIEKMKKKGFTVKHGDFGENILIKDIPLYELPPGTLLKCRNGVVFKITMIGKECIDRCSIYQKIGDCIMPREGVFAKVIKSGLIKKGEEVTVQI
ncbi:MAG: cyclic pyranopterin monophosphate synthase MoaC [Spirochaetes bacterium]|nr:cyclic pyranopterin monophosphate synthase MoaC [Spirochaetota bacterium]